MYSICRKISIITATFNIVFLWAQGEFLIDTNLVYDPAPSVQESPSVVFDGRNYFVVWQDERGARWFPDIYGARMDQSGNVLDPSGIAISTAAWLSQTSPTVACDSTNYLVVWAVEEEYYAGYYRLWIDGAVVSKSGSVLSFIGNIGNTYLDHSPSVAFDGTNYLVVWCHAGGDIYGTRVSPTGTILDSMRIAISTTMPLFQRYPQIAYGGEYYLVVWQDERSGNDMHDIYGARVSPSGYVLDSVGIAISTAAEAQIHPSVSFDGENYLVVWGDYRNGSDYDIYGARIDQYGNVLDSSGIFVSTALESQTKPSVGFDNSNYLVTWQDFRNGHYDIYGSRVNQSGAVLDPSGIPIAVLPDWQTHSAVTSDGEICLVVWENGHPLYYKQDICGARVNQSGTVIDTSTILISTVVNEQREPSVAFDGTNYLVVWQEYRNSFWDIYGARVNPIGKTIDSFAIAISTGSRDELCPAIAFGDADYLAVWEDGHIYGARVSQAGVVLDPSGFNISGGGRPKHYPSVGSDGTDYLVVWQDERNIQGTRNDIYGARVSSSGIVLDSSGIAISTAIRDQVGPAVAFGGEDYFVVWTDDRWTNDRGNSSRVYGARVSSSGDVLDTAGILIPPDSSWSIGPLVAFDGTNYLVVWKGFQSGNWYYFGVRVSQSGVVIDSTKLIIAPSSGSMEERCLSFDGSDYIFVWERPSVDRDLYGVKVDTSCTVIDSFVVSQQPGNQLCPAIAHGLKNKLLITYSGWTDTINANPANLMRIWGKFYPSVGVEEDTELQKFVTKVALDIYPNPVHDMCNVKYVLSQKTSVCISLYDVTGRLTKKLIDETQDAGIYCKVFDVANLSQGVYFMRLETVDNSAIQKIVLTR